MSSVRRYDIDWLRVIAIGLLLIYHVAIGFQSWGIMIGFISNDKSWDSLWFPMAMLNVWRIPLLFFVSGMGVYFSIQNRNWKQLLKERTIRIFIPFLFGVFAIVPVSTFLFELYYHLPYNYSANPGHLWFLGNIFIYVIIFLPLFIYLKRNEEGKMARWIKKIMSNPISLLIVIASFMIEAVIVNPNPYELYAMTWHGFFLGMLAFFFGFCFMLGGSSFRNMLQKYRWLFLIAAILLYAYRLMQPLLKVPNIQLSAESDCWIFSMFAFGSKYLNHFGKTLSYLSQAVYPVYIVHMMFLFLASLLIFPLNIDVRLKFILALFITVAGSFIFYEFIIRRINFIRPLFGLKIGRNKSENSIDKFNNNEVIQTGIIKAE